MEVPRWLDRVQWALLGPEGVAGRVVLAWTLAGGIFGGGLLIGALALLGRGSPGLHLLLAPVLFLLGTLLGAVQGFLLVLVAGRGCPARTGLQRGLIGILASVPLLPVSWLVSAAIAVGTALRAETRTSWLVVSLSGTLVGLVVCGWAAREGWRMVTRARS